jgi:ribosome-associated protein
MEITSGRSEFSSEELAGIVVQGMMEKKGMNIVQLDLRKIHNRVVDFFVICHGGSAPQVDALAESVEKTVKLETGSRPHSIEGLSTKEWVLIDYFDVVVHIFTGAVREFYRLEALWADAEVTNFEEQNQQR